MGTKFKSYYKKGDQLFNCYGRRNNRFLLLNYGFCMIDNKYNSLGFKVFVNDGKDGKYQKILKLKQNRLCEGIFLFDSQHNKIPKTF